MGSPKKRIQYRYDAVGNRVGMTDPDGGRFTYTYDAVNRITEVINPQGDRTSYAYDAGGRRTVKKLANGTRASFSYDAASNLARLANLKSDGTTISSFNYDYDRVGNRTSVVEADGSRVTWSYDDMYQLTGEHRTGTTPYEDSYSYDPAGNRLLKVHDGARTTYSYDAANQVEWSEDASGRTTYTFDADGNQQLVVEPAGDRTTTSWDYENRTTLVELPSGIRNTMAYEPGGLRMKLEESTGTKKFVWDDQNYLAETDENDDTQIVYTNEPRVYGNLVSQRRGTDSHWYQFDVIGSTRELTDSAETVTATRLYDAWGNELSHTGGVPLSLPWVGQSSYYLDADTHSYYIRARMYRPVLGRWFSADPLGHGINRFRYVHNLPVQQIDPSGLIGVHPPADATPDECNQWRRVCKADCQSIIGIVPIRTIRECMDACDVRADRCVDTATDYYLAQHLFARCCARLPFWLRADCFREVAAITSAMKEVRDYIDEHGGAVVLGTGPVDDWGQVCIECQEQVAETMPALDYFKYGAVLSNPTPEEAPDWIGGAPGLDHAWGVVSCIRTGEIVATIDFWCGMQSSFTKHYLGGRDRIYWLPGNQRFGPWEPTEGRVTGWEDPISAYPYDPWSTDGRIERPW